MNRWRGQRSIPWLKRLLSAFALALALSATGAAEDPQAGRESIFLFGAGARALGMGGAFSAVADDASAAYYNPAGLAFLQMRELSFLHAVLFEGVAYDFAAGVYPTLDFGTFGVGGVRIGTDGVAFRDRLGQLGEFSYTQGQYWLAYSYKLNRIVAAGLNLKYQSESLADLSTSTGSADLGILANFHNTLLIGLNAQDLVGGKLKLGSAGEKVPSNLKGGIALRIAPSGRRLAVLAAADLDKTAGQSVRAHFGAELAYRQMFFVRGGYDRTEPTLGAGLKYRFLSFDYAYKGHSQLGATHRFGLSLFFGPSLESQRTAREGRRRQAEEQRAEKARQLQVQTLLIQAGNLYQAERLDSALFSYSQVLAYDPENALALQRIQEINRRLAAQVNEKVDRQAARETITKLQQSYLAVADSLFAAGDLAGAKAQYQKVLGLDSTQAQARARLLAIDTQLQNRFDSLTTAAERHLAQQRYAEAIEALGQAATLKPGDRGVRDRSAFAKQQLWLAQKLKNAVELLNRGDTAGAKAAFTDILQTDPEYQTALRYLDQLKEKERARPVTLDELKADAEIWKVYLEGLEAFGRGDYAQAISKWEKVLEKYPGSVDAQENIRQARLLMKKPGQ